MKILILGGSGMLGHRLWINLSKQHETWVTVRGEATEIPEQPEFPRHLIRANVDALYFEQVTRAFASIQPDLVINCIGLIKQMGHLARDPLFSISLNSMLPHKVSMLCRVAKIRMIHISTDCVFSGKRGHYTEADQSDAEDLYGRTKYLGEVAYPHTITLRTSIIGRELRTNLGLIDWFLAQKGIIRGYKKAIFTGFTTDELSHIIENYVIPHPEIHGVYQVSSNPVTKYDLLQLTKQAFNKTDVEILPDEDFFCDRSLDSARFRQATGYCPPEWPEMLREMAENSQLYNRLGK